MSERLHLIKLIAEAERERRAALVKRAAGSQRHVAEFKFRVKVSHPGPGKVVTEWDTWGVDAREVMERYQRRFPDCAIVEIRQMKRKRKVMSPPGAAYF